MKKKKRVSKKWWWVFGGIIASLFVVGIVVAIVFSHAPKFEDRGVPIINIELNGVSLEEIDSGSKETKYEGNSLSVYGEGMITSYENVEIKGRGNGTWPQIKKPYRIRFDEKVDLFGLGKAKKWCLLANYMDGTSMRTSLAFRLERMLDMKYSFDGKFIELYINGEYRGLYYLTHVVEIGKQVVDLKDALGILVELDNYYGAIEENYVTKNGNLLVIQDLVIKDNKKEAIEDFLDSFNAFEVAIEERDYEIIKQLVDVESFAQYYLLSEFTVNPDAYWTSFYMYKDGIEDKIHAGPGWDFDLIFGNYRWGNWLGDRFYSPTETMIRKQELEIAKQEANDGNDEKLNASRKLSTILFDLMEMPGFRDEVVRIFQEKLSGREEELIEVIRSSRKMISEAAKANGIKWGQNDYIEETSRMIDWIKMRFDFFEKEYSSDQEGDDPGEWLQF